MALGMNLSDHDNLPHLPLVDRPIGTVVQSADGTIQAGDVIAAQLLGYSVEQLTGMTLFDASLKITHSDGSPFLLEEVSSILALRDREVTLRFYHPDGQQIWLHLSFTPLF
jgi:PAS domain S-box-containing protein